MDLGAMVCAPRRPDCEACPLSGLCQAYWRGIQEQLPQRAERKAVPLVRQVALLMHCKGRYLIQRRPLEGMLGGLWEFPTVAVPDGKTVEAALHMLLAGKGQPAAPEPLGTVRHAYSHFRVELHLFTCPVQGDGMVADEDHRWLLPRELADWPLHGSHKKALGLL
jgi:A/G-specific adenine glycosylase